MHAPSDLIRLDHLTTGYRLGRGARTISTDLTLSIPAGSLVMLMGPNGSGKSTLMHTMAGLTPPLSGEIHISSRRLTGLPAGEMARLLSLVLTDRITEGGMTVADVVAIGRYPYTGFFGHLTVEDRRIIDEALSLCSLTDMRTRLVAELSDGERQRVMIARALAQRTPLILLDEPTAHLDLPSRLSVIAMLRQLAHDLGKAILVSTHELDLALSYADRIWLMDTAGTVTDALPADIVREGHLERVFGNAPRESYEALARLWQSR